MTTVESLLAGLWLVFIVWTLRWFGSEKVRRDKIAYNSGVKEFGFLSWLGATGVGF